MGSSERLKHCSDHWRPRLYWSALFVWSFTRELRMRRASSPCDSPCGAFCNTFNYSRPVGAPWFVHDRHVSEERENSCWCNCCDDASDYEHSAHYFSKLCSATAPHRYARRVHCNILRPPPRIDTLRRFRPRQRFRRPRLTHGRRRSLPRLHRYTNAHRDADGYRDTHADAHGDASAHRHA